MIRRGFMRVLTAGLVLPAISNGRPQPAPPVGSWGDGGLTTPGGVSVEEAQKWKAYDLLRSQHTSILRRKREVSFMLGGLPPHIAANRSWSPTYAAMKAVEWQEKQDREAESLHNKLLRMVGLEP